MRKSVAEQADYRTEVVVTFPVGSPTQVSDGTRKTRRHRTNDNAVSNDISVPRRFWICDGEATRVACRDQRRKAADDSRAHLDEFTSSLDIGSQWLLNRPESRLEEKPQSVDVSRLNLCQFRVARPIGQRECWSLDQDRKESELRTTAVAIYEPERKIATGNQIHLRKRVEQLQADYRARLFLEHNVIDHRASKVRPDRCHPYRKLHTTIHPTTHVPPECGHFVYDFPRVRNQCVTERRQFDLASTSIKQLATDVTLQLHNASTQGRSGDVQLLRRPREIERICHSQKVMQMTQLHTLIMTHSAIIDD